MLLVICISLEKWDCVLSYTKWAQGAVVRKTNVWQPGLASRTDLFSRMDGWGEIKMELLETWVGEKLRPSQERGQSQKLLSMNCHLTKQEFWAQQGLSCLTWLGKLLSHLTSSRKIDQSCSSVVEALGSIYNMARKTKRNYMYKILKERKCQPNVHQ